MLESFPHHGRLFNLLDNSLCSLYRQQLQTHSFNRHALAAIKHASLSLTSLRLRHLLTQMMHSQTGLLSMPMCMCPQYEKRSPIMIHITFVYFLCGVLDDSIHTNSSVLSQSASNPRSCRQFCYFACTHNLQLQHPQVLALQ